MSRISAPANAGIMPTDRQILEAYRQWLHFEARLLALELYPDAAPEEAIKWVPEGTVAAGFHFPEVTGTRPGRTWRDVPPPSTRAEAVLRAVGVLDGPGKPDQSSPFSAPSGMIR